MQILINFLLAIYVLVALLMLLVILMQRPKSEGLGAAFGGGVTENIFGAQTTNVLVKFTGWLAGIFFALTFTQAGTVSLTLASLTLGPRNPTLTTIVGLGFGTPAGTDCSLTTSLKTGAGLVAQINSASGTGTFCVDIFDAGNLATPVDFVVRIVHP